MKTKLEGKIAVVTGAAKGIGAAIAQALAAQGAAVVVNYVSDQANADRIVSTITMQGGKAIAVQADVANSTDVQRLFAKVKEVFGQVDILVNNAAISRFGPVESITETDFQQQYHTNVLGPILTIQQALNYFPPAGGSIINISSVAGQNPGPYTSLYASTKAALNALTISLSRELALRNIRVNTVAPGNTDTEGARALGLAGTDIEKALLAATPLGRVGKPEEVAPMVAFLASDDAAWITGEKIATSGGMR
ncbi:SDR family oxidoreductase [Xanthocytophaga agilis]|uniref:SDR family oxidoreductase n=1 Tax=Xanthocytophaga agilis TaxID=3048010 RepID=A0AAE3REN8_9BACT|nr:SDR family oxidoreductase [Xanthocytophaga agilis]MDJ1506888.1 SDR family oxidoreductase [Xanthocytophaga agilis]